MTMVISQSKAIKKKLMAATSMLLVASIMLISSSYAWFTLSTAPEVTGITTAVGANGNLEIALANADSWSTVGTSIQSNVGDSTLAINAKNVTWGNLVDVSDATYYGLDKVKLMPARLNYATDGENNTLTNKVNLNALLGTPQYGTDGRVAQLVYNTMGATYDSQAEGFLANDTGYGVRAIGTSTGMTERQTAYRNAKSAVANNSSYASVYAAQSLNKNGSALANIIIQHSTNPETKYGLKEVEVIANVIEELTKASNNIDDALQNAIIGMAASKAAETTLDAEKFEIFKTEIEAGDYTVSDTGVVTLKDVADVSYSLGSDFATMFNKAKAIKSAIAEAESKNNALATANEGVETNEIEWSEISAVLTPLVNPSSVQVNGVDALVIKDNIQTLIDAVLGGSGIQVQMPTGSGVYSDIADFCGDYSAQITLENITYGGLTLSKTTAKMTTKTTVAKNYFSLATTAITAAQAPSSTAAGGENTTLTETYGYAVDLFFRTNVDNSSLKLQTEAAQRIYGESENEATQGGGSNMTFTAATGYAIEDMRDLMGAIRVVFMDAAGNIYATAKLDMADKVVTTTGEGENAKTTITGGTTVSGSTVTSDLKLYKVVETTTGEGESAVTTKSEVFLTDEETPIIMALAKNTPTALTALVYLDGDLVTNAMVANGTTSMTGAMNLQFSSTATLVPMENTSLFEGTVE